MTSNGECDVIRPAGDNSSPPFCFILDDLIQIADTRPLRYSSIAPYRHTHHNYTPSSYPPQRRSRLRVCVYDGSNILDEESYHQQKNRTSKSGNKQPHHNGSALTGQNTNMRASSRDKQLQSYAFETPKGPARNERRPWTPKLGSIIEEWTTISHNEVGWPQTLNGCGL